MKPSVSIASSLVGWWPRWVYRDKQPNTDSAQQYSFETLALAPHSVIDHAVHAPDHPSPIAGMQVQVVQTVRIDGMPTLADTIRSPNLIDISALGLGPINK